jgi:protein involved in polysaccharide export with SLBB domain
VILALCAGCIGPVPHIRSALKTPLTAPAAETTASYTLACPDVVDVFVTNRHNASGRYTLDPDGTITLAGDRRVSVDGQTPQGAAVRLAAAIGVPAQRVRVAVAEHNSRLLFLFGPGAGEERAVPFQGPETVVELLRRTGGLTAQAKPDEVHVVRAHVAAGRRPEVFNVDLEAIVIRGDERSNVVLQPYDQVYVAATRRSTYARYLPGGDWTPKPASR